MKTEIITVNPDNINPVYIKTAAEKIKDGGLVAFPTETVYGLGADAFNPKAVAKIFEAKKRPFEDPLIVHIAQKEDLYKLTEDIPDSALKLADEFWPGPLTLVLKKSKNIPDIITAGLDTVAIRVPADKVALAFIKFSETPIAAPSANLFGRPSPTTAQHVLDDLNEKIDIVIDGGRALIGVESTILDLTQNPPVVLRPGGVSIEKLKKVVKGVEIYKQDKILSPGMYPRHYSPKAKVMLVEGNGNAQVEQVKNLASRFNLQDLSVGILAKEENIDKYNGFKVKSIGQGNDLAVCASNLFSVLREFDKEGVDIVIAESVKEEELGLAIMNRLRKAAGE
ncbi:MAG: threonylcarbamoyl-AMP synthase [Candidatus Omnitrophica bacterium]|nr:threonylcarbamoyl-AMP synthase [Candidatus Omnitrophota bacterium]MBU1524181.1 threonylcarbamoyl-AMP synthase [Candidatus Omnitrophota bacterium]